MARNRQKSKFKPQKSNLNQAPRAKARGAKGFESSRATNSQSTDTQAVRQRGYSRGIRPPEIDNQTLSLQIGQIRAEIVSDITDSQIEYLIMQYNAIRNEVTDSFLSQKSTLNTGIASIGGLVVAGLAFSGNKSGSDAFSIVYGFLLPLVSSCFMLIWLGDIERMVRAGQFLREIEKKICELNKTSVYGWENWKFDKQNSLQYNYVTVIFLWTAIIIGAPLINTIIIGDLWLNYINWLSWSIIASLLNVFIWMKSKRFNASKNMPYKSSIGAMLLKNRKRIFPVILIVLLILIWIN